MKELLLYQTKKMPDVPIFSDAYCTLYTSAGSRGWVQGSKGRGGCQHHACFATTRMIPRNWMHDSDVLHAWFIFNVHTRISLIFTQCTIKLLSARCTGNRWLNPLEPHLLGELVSCSWWRIPIHSGPLPGSNCPALWLLPPSPLSPYPFSPIALYTTMTSTIMVFSFRDSANGTV